MQLSKVQLMSVAMGQGLGAASAQAVADVCWVNICRAFELIPGTNTTIGPHHPNCVPLGHMLEMLHWALNDRPGDSARGFSLRPNAAAALEQMELDGEISWDQAALLCISPHDTWDKDTIIKRATKCGDKLKVRKAYGLK